MLLFQYKYQHSPVNPGIGGGMTQTRGCLVQRDKQAEKPVFL
jgi:hypothetical protein